MKSLFYAAAVLLAVLAVLPVRADVIANRQAFFRKIQKSPLVARSYLNDKDPDIRRYALYCVIKKNPAAAFDAIAAALNDPEEQVCLTAVQALPQLLNKDKRVRPLLEKVARENKFQQVRQIAVQATWPFHREVRLLRDDPTWDYEVKTIKSIPLEKLPWFFTTDPLQEGHLKGFFKPEYNTSAWKSIKMGVWENQGFSDYDGVAWYKITFVMPEKMDCNAVEIAFDGVDESAWVWLNGIYLGAHDKGPEGWREPFAVDCRKEIRWGEKNTLVIRVNDTAYAGGIYKPVRVDILK